MKHEICKTTFACHFFLTTGQRDNNILLPVLDPPLQLIWLKYIQNIQINNLSPQETCSSYYSYQLFQNNGMSSMTICKRTPLASKVEYEWYESYSVPQRNTSCYSLDQITDLVMPLDGAFSQSIHNKVEKSSRTAHYELRWNKKHTIQGLTLCKKVIDWLFRK